MTQPIVIGVSGISGAGKTELVKALAKKLGSTSLFWDDFDEISKSPSDYVEWYKRGAHYDEFDYQALADVIKVLKEGQSVGHPGINTILNPTDYIIVDAPMGRAHYQTSQYIDMFVHIDIPLDIALSRRLIRNIQNGTTNSKDIVAGLNEYLKRTRPLFTEESVCVTSNTADLVVDGADSVQVQVKAVINYVNKIALSLQPDLHLDIVDEVDKQTKEIMKNDLARYESDCGVDVNYKRFSLVLAKDNQAVGVLNAYTAFSEIYVDNLWVHHSHRKNGYGKLLLSYLEAKFRGKGFNNINLVTGDFSAPEFYKKCGFKAEFKRYNEKNPQLTKTFFVKYFGESNQYQGVATGHKDIGGF